MTRTPSTKTTTTPPDLVDEALDAGPVIEIDTSTLARPIARPTWARIGGIPMLAKCPKLDVWRRLHAWKDNKDAGGADHDDQLEYLFTAIVGPENAAKIRAMIDDPSVDDVGMETLSALIAYLNDGEGGPQWGKALENRAKELTAEQKPRTLAVSKSSSRKPAAPKARKTAAKKTTTRKQ